MDDKKVDGVPTYQTRSLPPCDGCSEDQPKRPARPAPLMQAELQDRGSDHPLAALLRLFR